MKTWIVSSLGCRNYSREETIRGNTVVSALVFLLFNENLNSFLTRVQKLFTGGNYLKKYGIFTIFNMLSRKYSQGIQFHKILEAELRTYLLRYCFGLKLFRCASKKFLSTYLSLDHMISITEVVRSVIKHLCKFY